MGPRLRPLLSDDKLCLLLQSVGEIAFSVIDAGLVLTRRSRPGPSYPTAPICNSTHKETSTSHNVDY